MKNILLFTLTFFLETEVKMEYLKMGKITHQEVNYKQNAFNVLVLKCNKCHTTKKKRTIFTLENMSEMAVEINNQVFIKQKMPKGKKNKLTENEALQIKDWLNSLQ